MPLVPPLDFIPKLPGQGVQLVSQQLDRQLDLLFDQISTTVQDSIKLPVNSDCSDPRVNQIKDQLLKIQELITSIQENIPKIQQTINSLNSIISTAQTIRNTITVAQLANPVTAGLFIAQQLIAIQDATIVNTLAALQQFSTIPDSISSRLSTVLPSLISTVNKVSTVCNGEIEELILPENIAATITEDYNDTVPTTFYTETNVSDSDLEKRSNDIETLIQQQQDLLTSLLEAPSQVYQLAGAPDSDLGKAGDYYIDLNTSQIYGPKISATEWGRPVN